MATHYLPLHQIFIFQYTLIYPIYPPPCRFNTATRRWLVAALNQAQTAAQFQHAAALPLNTLVSTHSRPKALATGVDLIQIDLVSTHSRPKAAASVLCACSSLMLVSTHSRPKAAAQNRCLPYPSALFQHTAARRRLGFDRRTIWAWTRFNTQPPEGGWSTSCV